MYEQPPLETWAIFCLEEDEYSLNKFRESFNDTLQIFNYQYKEPKIIKIKSKSFTEWDKTLREHLDSHVIVCIIILPGIKG